MTKDADGIYRVQCVGTIPELWEDAYSSIGQTVGQTMGQAISTLADGVLDSSLEI